MSKYYKNLKDKTVIITGGASGLGTGIAKILATQGAIISLIDINSSNLEQTKKELDNIGGKTFVYNGDVTNQIEVKNIINEIKLEMGHIDILVNSAGVIGAVDFENTGSPSLEDWDATYSVNVKGTAIVSEEVAKFMKIKNYGKIINISSHAAKYPNPDNTAYGASKAAVISLTQSLAAKLAKNNINVNVICPGSIWTPMWKRWHNNGLINI